jgi:hypothetical protein
LVSGKTISENYFFGDAIFRYYPRIQKPIKKKKLIRKLTLIIDKEEEEE